MKDLSTIPIIPSALLNGRAGKRKVLCSLVFNILTCPIWKIEDGRLENLLLMTLGLI